MKYCYARLQKKLNASSQGQNWRVFIVIDHSRWQTPPGDIQITTLWGFKIRYCFRLSAINMSLCICNFLLAFKKTTVVYIWHYRGIWLYLNHLLSAFYWDCHHCHHRTFPSPLPGGFPWAVHCEHFGAPKTQNDLLSVLTSIKSLCII